MREDETGVDKMGVDEMRVDEMRVDIMGVKRSENEARKTCIDLIYECVNVRLRHSLPDGKLQKEERALCFIAGLL